MVLRATTLRVGPDKLIARQNDPAARIRKHRHRMPRHLNFLPAESHKRGTMFAVANAGCKAAANPWHIVVFRQNQMQTARVFDNGTDLGSETSPAFPRQIPSRWPEYRPGRWIPFSRVRARGRWRRAKYTTHAVAKPKRPDHPRKTVSYNAHRGRLFAQPGGDPSRKHFPRLPGNFRQPRLLQNRIQFRIGQMANLAKSCFNFRRAAKTRQGKPSLPAQPSVFAASAWLWFS